MEVGIQDMPGCPAAAEASPLTSRGALHQLQPGLPLPLRRPERRRQLLLEVGRGCGSLPRLLEALCRLRELCLQLCERQVGHNQQQLLSASTPRLLVLLTGLYIMGADT